MGMGLLTLPIEFVSTTFIRLYGLFVKGQTVLFSQSNKPLSTGVVERLRSTTWEDPQKLQKEREPASKPITPAKVYYGHFCDDGSFSIESTPPDKGEIACDLILPQVKLTMDP
jgi:hypothetical protein